MKKLLLMAAGLLGFAATSVAQTDGPVELTTDTNSPKYYLIKNVRSGKYANAVSEGTQLRQSVVNASDELYEFSNLWYFVAADDATAADGWTAVRIYNANVTDKCIANPVNGTWSAATETDNIWYLNNTAETKSNHTGHAINHQALHTNGQAWNDYYGQGQLIAYDHSNDGGSVWVFEAADADKVATTIDWRNNSIEVTYTFPFLNQTAKTRVLIGRDATNYIPAHPLFTEELSIAEENKTVAADRNTFTVVGEPNFDQVFRMSLRNRQTCENAQCRYFRYDDATGQIVTRAGSDGNESAFVPERLFYLKKSENSTADKLLVTLHCIAVKDNYGFQNTSENKNIGTMTDTPQEYEIVSNSWESNDFFGFSLHHPGHEKAHLNDVDFKLGCWTPAVATNDSQNDSGSCFRLYSLTEEDIEGFNYVSTDAVKTQLIAAAKANKSVANIRAIFDGGQVDAETLTSSYFRITFVDGNKNLTVVGYADETGAIAAEDGEHNLVKQAVANETDMSQIWHFVNASSERSAYPIFGICSANANGYYLNHVKYLVNNLVSAYKYRVYRDGDVYVARIGGDWSDNYLNPSNTGNDEILTYNSGFRVNGNKFRLTAVTEIAIPIADGETFATVAFPFAVKANKSVFAAETTQTHYSNGGSYLKLAEVSNENTIPAGTGVLIEDATTFTLVAPNAPAENVIEANLLTGTTLKRQGTFAANSHFALNGTTFDKNAELTELPANSAILSVDAITNENHKNAASLVITKDDVSTSISEIVAGGENGANMVYDLQGRRVNRASKGIFIVNGVKTLVK